MGVYDGLGVQPIINASGAVTRLGGAPMPQEVLQAYCDAANHCVPLDHLQAAASKWIAAATGTEAGLVTAGAAAALTLGTAAILAGDDLRRMELLPHCEAFPHEIIIAREQRSGYDHAIRASGARLVEVGFNEIVANAGVRRTEASEFAGAIGPHTAGVAYVFADHSRPDLAEVVEVAHKHQLPVIVDAAGELPPKSRLTSIPATGADLVVFSGGKAIRGPQSTGILCGRKDLIGSAALQMLDMDDHPSLWEPPATLIDRSRLAGMPRHGIGRGFKVSKEEIVALLTALRMFVADAYREDSAVYRDALDRIAAGVADLSVACRIEQDAENTRPPWLEITLDPHNDAHHAFEICRNLRNGDPPIYVGHGKLDAGTFVIHPMHLGAGQADIIVRRLREEIRER